MSRILAWLARGAELRSGDSVPAGTVGVRLVGDVELVGEPAELAEMGQRMATRWMSPLVSAVQDWAAAVEKLTDSSLPGGLTCGEADVFARLLAVSGHADTAAEFLFSHAQSDEKHDNEGDEDDHFYKDDHFYIRHAARAAEFAASMVDLATDYGPARKLAAEHVTTLTGGQE